jgi:hypothetical protein
MYRSLLAILLLASPAFGQTLTLPAEVRGQPGSFISIPAKTDGKIVRWVSLDSGLQLFPVELLKDSKTAVATGPTGSYRLLAYTSVKDSPSEPAICVVIIGVPPPPPVPPAPVNDPLADAARLAFQMEFAATKLEDAAGFAQVYRHGIALAATAPTLGKLYEGIGGKVAELKLQGKLPHVQKAINAELSKMLPNPIDNPALTIDDASRALINRHFLRAAKAFEGLQ